jgi:hypothetical protein
MDKFQVLALMMREENEVMDANLYTVCAMLADRLSMISDRLSEEEMMAFVQVGAVVYRHGMAEFGSAVPIEDLFPANENWPSGPCPGRGGFRHRE